MLKGLNDLKAFKDFKSWSVTYQLLGLLIILVSIPVTVLLVRSFALYLSRAATARVYWSQGSNTNLTSIDMANNQEQSVTVTVDVHSDQVNYFQVKVGFDKNLINLAAPINPSTDLNPYFQTNASTGILPDTQAEVDQANASGEFLISLPGDQNIGTVTGIQQVVDLSFVGVSNNTTSTQITYIETCFDQFNNPVPCTNIVAVPSFQSLPVQLDPLTVNLNGGGGVTVTPTTTVPTPTSPPGGDTIILDTEADTYVDASQPNNAFGSETTMQVDGSPDRISYFKFTLPNVNPSQVTSVKLRLNAVSNEGASTTQQIYKVANIFWSEASMNYNTRSPLSGARGYPFTLSNTGFNEIDVTNYIVNELINIGAQRISFAIATVDSLGYTYGTRESATPPQLVFSISDTPAPTPTPTTITPPPTPTGSLPPDTTLSFSTPNTTVQVGSEFPVFVNINTGLNEVIGVELDIDFQSGPDILTAIDIGPGTFFPNPDETNKFIDNGLGTLEYTILTPPDNNQQNAVRGIGQLAVIDFRADVVGQTTLTFTSPDTIVAARNVYQNALRSTFPITITVVANLCGNQFLPGDITGPDGPTGPSDCIVNILDYSQLFQDFGLPASQAEDPDSDISSVAGGPVDFVVNILDYVYLFENFGRSIL